jgi:O-antigen/teichoic acid export membrane protein
MAEPDAQSSGGGMARGLAGVTVAALLGNILAYLLLLVAARTLNPPDYSVLITLLNLLLIGSIPSFALQAVAARRIATASDHALRDAGLVIGAGAGLLMAAASPVVGAFLHLDGVIGPVLVGLALPGIAVQGLAQGLQQGRQKFGALAMTTFLGIAGRFGPALVVVLLGGSATATLIAVVLGVSAAAVASAWPLPELGPHGRPGAGGLVPSMIECAHASHGYGVFLLLSVSDLLLARHVLSAGAAALYAAGSVLTKAALWLPQSAANVLFASLTDASRHRAVFLRAVAGIAGLGAVVTGGAWLLQGLVAAVVGGNRYPELADRVWLFAALGSCLALLQFALVAGLAVRRTRVTVVIWACVAAEALGVLLRRHPSVTSVVASVLIINVTGVVLAVLLTARSGRQQHALPQAEPLGHFGSSPGHGPGT